METLRSVHSLGLAIFCTASALLPGCAASQSRVDEAMHDYQERFARWVQRVSQEPNPAVQKEMVADRPLPDDYAEKLFEIVDAEQDAAERFKALRWLYAKCQGESHRDKALATILERNINDSHIVTIAPHLERDAADRAPAALREFEQASSLQQVRAVGRVSRAAWLIRHQPSERKHAEKLLLSACEEYGAVSLDDDLTIRDVAEAHLFDLRNLAVGAIVPEVRGIDQHGSHLALSSFRGSVVLMPFWAHW